MENDKEILIKALRIEGISQDKMVFEKYPTFVMENGHKILGFFTIKAEWGFPSLQLYVDNPFENAHGEY